MGAVERARFVFFAGGRPLVPPKGAAVRDIFLEAPRSISDGKQRGCIMVVGREGRGGGAVRAFSIHGTEAGKHINLCGYQNHLCWCRFWLYTHFYVFVC